MSKPVFIIGLFAAILVHYLLLVTSMVEDVSPLSRKTHTMKTRAIETDSGPVSKQVQSEALDSARSKPVPKSQGVSKERSGLTRTAMQRYNSMEKSGDLHGESDGEEKPVLRIDWGTSQEAKQIVQVAGLRLVMISESGSIVSEVKLENGRWVLSDMPRTDLSMYSNRLRIVDSTPAFKEASSLRPGRHRLAILVPLPIERMIKREQIKSAAMAGIDSERVLAFYGCFHIRSGEVEFSINEIERRLE